MRIQFPGRVFQAIRIAVNDEFGALGLFLRELPGCLKPGGCVGILAFHSGEDRRVKHAFREGVRTGIYSAANDEIVRAGPEERRANNARA
ncbi:MAG: 16S rRNA (cytosine(1402)-N(4))-methyltransferase [Verrucomicrobia bacterium]|nr:16S rRNA (cytosine(1402)-N(4))-methyltransferase [Verrucomicrobiota bacterium]